MDDSESRFTEEQNQVLNQILLEIATSQPSLYNKNMSVGLMKPMSQTKAFLDASLAFKNAPTELRPDDGLVYVTVPVTDKQSKALASGSDAPSKVLNEAFADVLRPDTGHIDLLVAVSATNPAIRQTQGGIADRADIYNLGGFKLALSKSAFKSLAIKALTRLADPKEGAAMLGISAEDYQQKLSSKDPAISRKISEVLTNAGFIKTEQQVVDLVQTVNAAQQFEFAAILNDAVEKLPKMQATATAADKITRGRTSASRPGNIIT